MQAIREDDLGGRHLQVGESHEWIRNVTVLYKLLPGIVSICASTTPLLLTSTQDCNHYHGNVGQCSQFSQVVSHILTRSTVVVD